MLRRALHTAKRVRAHPVLGTRPSEEYKWNNCDLAKVLVKNHELAGPPQLNTIHYPIGDVQLPSYLAYGISSSDSHTLFAKLPKISSEAALMAVKNDPIKLSQNGPAAEEAELRKANLFAKAIDLRNADAAGIAHENRRRIIIAFSTPENPFDTGRTEVQAAILTYRIRNLYNHLQNFPRDVGNKLSLRKLVHQRAKVLRYLKRKNRARYDFLLPRLALEPDSVEGELIV